jgi:hypothetical protein
MMGSSEDVGEVGLETAHDLLIQIRPILQRFDGGGALASVDDRRNAAISNIGVGDTGQSRITAREMNEVIAWYWRG